MSLVVGDTVVFHIPKTGGMWIRELLKANGVHFNLHIPKRGAGGWERILAGRLPGNNENHHLAAWPMSLTPKRVAAIIREPVSWYESLWLYRTEGPWMWDYSRPFDRMVQGIDLDDFREFINRVAEVFPEGFLTRLYNAYAAKTTDLISLGNVRGGLERLLDVELRDVPSVNSRRSAWRASHDEAEFIRLYERDIGGILAAAS